MNSELLLTHFNRVSTAPGAVQRLRRFILDLAVRGKLVEQRPTDESAAILITRIATETAQSGKSKGTIRPDLIGLNDAPFDIPPNWAWVRLGAICSKTGSGSTPRGGKSVYQRDGVPFLRSQNVHDDGLRLDDVAYISPQTHEKMSGTAVEPGDLLLNITGGSIGRCCLVQNGLGPANVSQHVAIIRTAIDGIQRYLHQLVLSPYFQSFVLREQTGAGRGGLPKNRMDRILVALPPLPEQHRIVSRVDELMGLCNRLLEIHSERENQRDLLTAASHHLLSNGANRDASRKHTHFFIGHFPLLTSRPDQIKHLRQTVLNLAVQGKLIPQDPADEPASELLKRIHAYNVNFVGGRGRTRELEVFLQNSDGIPFDVPRNWVWVPFGRIMISRDGERIPVSQEERSSRAKTYDYYGASGVIDKIDGYLFEKPLLLIGEDGANLINRSTPIAFIARGKYWVNNHAHVLDGMSEEFLRFIELYINATDLRPYVTGTAQPKMNQAKMNSIPVALPPEAEQIRIVAKVTELMTLCDQLEAQLTNAQSETSRLLETVLHHALHGNPQVLKAGTQ